MRKFRKTSSLEIGIIEIMIQTKCDTDENTPAGT